MSALTKFMSRGFVPPEVHGVLDFDYKAATVIALAFGAGAAVLALATARSTGIVKIIPPIVHGYADTLATLVPIVLP
jgi:hypothetical protein